MVPCIKVSMVLDYPYVFIVTGDIVGSDVGGSLATMPFQVLENLLEATPLTTDDGLLLRRMCLESGALHLILACLAALSHQDTPEVVSSLYHPVRFLLYDFIKYIFKN